MGVGCSWCFTIILQYYSYYDSDPPPPENIYVKKVIIILPQLMEYAHVNVHVIYT